MENPFTTQENTTPIRTTLLTVLLVLTFLGSGLNFIGNIYIATSFDTVLGMMEEFADDDAYAPVASIFDQYVNMMEKVGTGYFGLLTLLYLVSLVGAFFMWKLNKLGFHLYASAQILMLFIPMVFGMIKYPGLFATALTALFIWVYARELKIFKQS